MRKIVANFFISLDGVVERPDQWHFPYFNDEMGRAVGEGMAATRLTALPRASCKEILGRLTRRGSVQRPD